MHRKIRPAIIGAAAIALAGSGSLTPAAASPAGTPCGSAPTEMNVIVSDASIIRGTDGPDFICAGASDNLILAGDGDDVIFAGRGDDTVRGGSGNDKISGGGGSDKLIGGNGKDKLRGGPGNDSIFGGDQRDRLTGGSGDDTLNGGTGNDRLKGQRGADQLFGGKGNDKLDGGKSQPIENVVDGGSGTDKCENGLPNRCVTATATGEIEVQVSRFSESEGHGWLRGQDWTAGRTIAVDVFNTNGEAQDSQKIEVDEFGRVGGQIDLAFGHLVRFTDPATTASREVTFSFRVSQDNGTVFGSATREASLEHQGRNGVGTAEFTWSGPGNDYLQTPIVVEPHDGYWELPSSIGGASSLLWTDEDGDRVRYVLG